MVSWLPPAYIGAYSEDRSSGCNDRSFSPRRSTTYPTRVIRIDSPSIYSTLKYQYKCNLEMSIALRHFIFIIGEELTFNRLPITSFHPHTKLWNICYRNWNRSSITHAFDWLRIKICPTIIDWWNSKYHVIEEQLQKIIRRSISPNKMILTFHFVFRVLRDLRCNSTPRQQNNLLS